MRKPKRQLFERPPEEPPSYVHREYPTGYDTDEPPRLEGDDQDDYGREELD